MLTQNAQKMLRSLYQGYTANRSSGKSIDEARQFGKCSEIKRDYAPDLSMDDTNTVLHELKDNGYLHVRDYDNKAYRVILTDQAIAFMESKA